jgi:hypothetical protein
MRSHCTLPPGSQADDGFVENQLWAQSQVVFSAVHVVGSNNGLAPWGNLEAGNTALRTIEVAARRDAALEWIDQVFELADDEDALGVVIAMQADSGSPSRAESEHRLGRIASPARPPRQPEHGAPHTSAICAVLTQPPSHLRREMRRVPPEQPPVVTRRPRRAG